MNTVTVNFEADALLGDWQTKNQSASELVRRIAKFPDEHAAQDLSFVKRGRHDSGGFAGWTFVGTARIELTLQSPDAVVANEIASLQEQLRRSRIEAENAQRMLMDRISKLQALTMEAA